jgi:hypothetical protein
VARESALWASTAYFSAIAISSHLLSWSAMLSAMASTSSARARQYAPSSLCDIAGTPDCAGTDHSGDVGAGAMRLISHLGDNSDFGAMAPSRL